MKKKLYRRIVLIIVFLTVVLNLVAFSDSFCIWYSRNIYPLINAAVGTLTGWSKIAVGEIIMYIGAVMVVLLAVFSIVGLIMLILKKKKFLKFWKSYSKICLFVLVMFLFVYTVNWFIPFRKPVMTVGSDNRTDFTFEELEILRNDVVDQINEIVEIVPRDKDGRVICDFDQKEVFDLMKSRSDEYELLKGHYSPVKEALCSDELEWMGIGGYNYIYTMEGTYNRYTPPFDLPILISHETCHNKGYYLENEATFISSIILSESDDLFLRYSGLKEMLKFIEEEYEIQCLEIIEHDPKLNEKYLEIKKEDGLTPNENISDSLKAAIVFLKRYPQVSMKVYDDDWYSNYQAVELYENNVNEVLKETTEEIFSDAAETGWDVQGEILKENTYSGALLMYLQYYYSNKN